MASTSYSVSEHELTMDHWARIQSLLFTWLIVVLLWAGMAIYDIQTARVDRRPVTGPTVALLYVVATQQLVMLLGAWVLHKHSGELEKLRRADVDNIGLRSQLLFTNQENEAMKRALLNGGQLSGKTARPERHRARQSVKSLEAVHSLGG